jgi:hypothetical protein
MICGMLLAILTAYLAYLALEIAFARAKIAFFFDAQRVCKLCLLTAKYYQ